MNVAWYCAWACLACALIILCQAPGDDEED